MSRFYFNLSKLLTGLITVFACMNIQADEVVQVQGQPVIVTTVPAPKEEIIVPQGYISCFTVPAGWSYSNLWVPEHKVCQYPSTTGTTVQGVAWVDSYWACTHYKTMDKPTQADCTTWEWRPGHWVKTLEVY